jgi:hypothetical protein
MTALGANQSEDAIYPSAYVDADGVPLNGDNHYVLHFDKGALPPVNAFWSVTLYDQKGFPVANPLNRFALGDRDRCSTTPMARWISTSSRRAPGPSERRTGYRLRAAHST